MTSEQPTEGDDEIEGFEPIGSIALRISGKIIARAGKRKLGRSAVRASNDNPDTGGAGEFERRAPWGE